jgi:glucosamine-6-phosphate deaminase
MPSVVPEVLPDATAVAELVAQCLIQARFDWPELPLGLATGRTMEPVYAALLARIGALAAEQRQQLLNNWLSFNLDEYVGLGSADAASFAAFMHNRLAGPLGLGPAQVRIPNGQAVDPEAEATHYANDLAQAGGVGLQLLGLGRNGHIGFNEPPCGPDAPCRVLTLSDSTRAQNAAPFGGDPRAVPEQVITLGTKEILSARAVLLVVTGADKADILRRSLQASPEQDVPASWLQAHGQLRVIVDRAAAAALSRC